LLSFGLVSSSGSLGSWLGVTSWKTWGSSEILLGLSVFGSSDQESVRSGWGGHNKLIEGEALSSGLDNSSSGGLGESEGSDGHLWDLVESVIVSDGGDSDDDLILSLKELSNLGDGDWWSVDSGGDESSQDGLAETGVGSSGKESEESDKKMDVQVLGFGFLLVGALDSSSSDKINTLLPQLVILLISLTILYVFLFYI
jgi:hypothetical protein